MWVLEEIFVPFSEKVTCIAGGYGVRNNPITREFLKMWAGLQFNEPRGFSSSDNGAIHVALMQWFFGKEDTEVSLYTANIFI